ncbi:glucuronate isomerase [Muricauda sp. CAU 1633]|uniref:glucuronate isomerase n=1 Tax=Allomuricauda sp. CAU 1633 TaxID=2816036 RepID=UPI001A8F4271|nr:glucuronate isomerase [Muricauda sp. CAU 1633]MBO0324104.1 glucuronate isomerase [Muricauda sp. CAU 1633]
MKETPFINDDFLLENEYAKKLYHNYASKQPIIDYHCHLSPEFIATDKVFKNLTEAWINGDHYKWRAMRTLGVDEKYITGNAPDEEKFIQWAKVVPYTVRNPLYHWTHLELSRYFGIDELLNEKNAATIYREASQKLNTSAYSCQNLLSKMKVETVCTTEDPVDTLEHHKALTNSDFKAKVSTSFRPDKAILIDEPNYLDYIDKLSNAVDFEINTYTDLCDALKNRIEFFNSNGCKLSDHGLNHIFYADFTENEIHSIFKKKKEGKELSPAEALKFKSALLLFLAETYHEFGWVQQFHLGALRNNNTRMLSKLGPDTGWDSIGDYSQAENLSKFLNSLDSRNKLSKTIIYNLNPADNEIMAAMIGNFNDGSVKGKVQYGSSWWFLDQKDGIIKQLNALSNIGVVSCFIGMLTDSRSFLSYPRHEYFRRVLCNLFGDEMHRGELPKDMELMGKVVSDISYNNAKEYFNF